MKPNSLPSHTHRSRDFLGHALLIAVIAAILMCGSLTPGHLWDFHSYYYSALAYAQGLNPYNFESVNSLIPDPSHQICRWWTYPYHPYTLWLFRPLTFFNLDTATKLYLFAISVSVVSLSPLLRRCLGGFSRYDAALLATLLLGGPGFPLLYTAASGNTASFDALLIWGALAFLRGARPTAAWGILSLAGFWKLVPFTYIPLTLLWKHTRTQWGCLLILLALAIALFFLPAFDLGSHFSDWRVYLAEVKNEEYQNHSLLAVALHLFPNHGTAMTAYALAVISILSFTYLKIQRCAIKPTSSTALVMVVLTAALIVPRVRPYNYLTYAPAILFIAREKPWLLALNFAISIFLAMLQTHLCVEHGLVAINIINWVAALASMKKRQSSDLVTSAPLNE